MALSAVREVNCQADSFYCITSHCIILSYIIFMTHLSVMISVYKLNLLLDVGHSGELLHGFGIQMLRKTAPKPQQSAMSNINRAQPHGNPIIWIVNRTAALRVTVSKLQHRHTTSSQEGQNTERDCPLTDFCTHGPELELFTFDSDKKTTREKQNIAFHTRKTKKIKGPQEIIV